MKIQLKQKKITNTGAISPGVKIIVFSFISVLAISLMVFAFYSIKDSCKYSESVAAIGEQKISIEEFNYFLKKAKDDRLLPAEAIKKIKDWDDKKVWSLEIGGKKTFDILKETTLNLAAKYKIEVQKAREKGISLNKDDYEAVENEINIKKIAGAGTEKEKNNFTNTAMG